MKKRVVLVSAAVAALGLAAAVAGFVAEATKSKAFVGYDGRRCVYRRTPALFYGIAAALLVLAGLALATAASGCFGVDAQAATSRRRAAAVRLSMVAWVMALVAAGMFLYGAALNWGGTLGLSMTRRRPRFGRSYYSYGCVVLKSGIFSTASILSAAASAWAIAVYIYLQRADDNPAAPDQFAAPGVAMGQPYPPPAYPLPPAYPPPPPPMAYPAPPQDGGYGAKQPAGPGTG